MGLNYNLYAPSIRPNLAFDVNLSPRSLRGIDVKADGTLFFMDDKGTIDSQTFTGVSSFVRLVMQIERIIGDGSGGIGDGVTGTNIPLESLRGLM